MAHRSPSIRSLFTQPQALAKPICSMPWPTAFATFIPKGWRLSLRLPATSWPATLAMYITLLASLRLLNSHTSGHSANDQFDSWWRYGILVSLALKLVRDRQTAAESGTNALQQEAGKPAGLAMPSLAPLRGGEARRPRRPAPVE